MIYHPKMSNSAVPISRSALQKFMQDMKRKDREKKDKGSGLDSKDVSLSELESMPGWNILKRYIERKIENLKPDFEMDSKDSDFVAMYGFRSIIFDILSEELQSIINRVEDANKVVQEASQEADA